MPDIQEADRILEASRLPRPPLYLVGIFNTGVTVLSQQRRALNLVWALVERHVISVRPPGAPIPEDKNDFKIAVIGGGFAGLSVAAGLIRKGALAQIGFARFAHRAGRRIGPERFVVRPSIIIAGQPEPTRSPQDQQRG